MGKNMSSCLIAFFFSFFSGCAAWWASCLQYVKSSHWTISGPGGLVQVTNLAFNAIFLWVNSTIILLLKLSTDGWMIRELTGCLVRLWFSLWSCPIYQKIRVMQNDHILPWALTNPSSCCRLKLWDIKMLLNYLFEESVWHSHWAKRGSFSATHCMSK